MCPYIDSCLVKLPSSFAVGVLARLGPQVFPDESSRKICGNVQGPGPLSMESILFDMIRQILEKKLWLF